MLTPMDIHNKEFKSGLSGYNKDEVDEFLDLIVVDFEQLYREKNELKDKLDVEMRKVENYISIEKTLQDTLVVAQSAAEEVVKNAKEKGELIVTSANEQAKKIVDEAGQRIVGLEAEYEELKKKVQIFKTRFKTLLESELSAMNEEFKEL